MSKPRGIRSRLDLSMLNGLIILVENMETWIKILGASRNNMLTDIITTGNSQAISIAEMNASTPTVFEFSVSVKVLVDTSTCFANFKFKKSWRRIYSVQGESINESSSSRVKRAKVLINDERYILKLNKAF